MDSLRLLLLALLLGLAWAKQKNGKVAQFLEDNHAAMICSANIGEELVPEMPLYLACCGFWNIRNFLMNKVEQECEYKAVEKLRSVSQKISAFQEERCTSYPESSMSCRMMIVVPVLVVMLSIFSLVGFCIFGCYSYCKWRGTEKKYSQLASEPVEREMQLKRGAENRMLAGGDSVGKRSLLSPARPVQQNPYDKIPPAYADQA